jgi:thiamine biosynthesis lipoprotein
MGTFVTIHVVDHGSDEQDRGRIEERREAIDRAFGWFRHVEACCTRFDPQSEVMRLSTEVGTSVPVSEPLYQAVAFALAVAEETAGAFDPTMGLDMETRGFNREHRTGRIVRTRLDPDTTASYRDVHLDPERHAIRLDRPLVLDLGAVAKGLAIDMAARHLRPFKDFAIDAGGDLFLAGRSPSGGPWTIGIRHPRLDRELVDWVTVSDVAVCTSGDYERLGTRSDSHHIVDPRTRSSATAVASVTVVGPTAMVADAIGTAAFVLGPVAGMRLLERQGVDGLFVSPTIERHATRGMYSRYRLGHATSASAC